MRRFYCSPDNIIGDKIYLKDKQLHHIKNVLRLKKGDKIIIFDGKGKQYNCIIEDITQKGVTSRTISSEFCLAKESPYRATLAQSIPNKPAKMDFVIEKATELGVDVIIPIASQRSVVRLNQKRAIVRRQKWQSIAEDASRQCGRSQVAKIGEVMSVKEAVSALANSELKLFPCIDKDTAKLHDVLKCVSKPKTVAVFIGPEGDFTTGEIKAARDNGFQAVSLGERVLRTETAGLYVLSILDYLWGQVSQD